MIETSQLLALRSGLAPWVFATVITLMVLEYAASRLAHLETHDAQETAVSFVIAIGNRIIRSIEAGLLAVPFLLAYQHRLFDIDLTSPLAWVALFLLVEFIYYWHHRASHTVRWLWATHSVHHSPTRFNLTAGIRLGWTAGISGHFLFYVPIALLGFHPLAIAAILGANLGYQFFIHSELVPRLGPLEWIFNTPTHHRVHHACNETCLDKNYGGTLIVFDRLFGTFAALPENEPLRYGLLGREPTNNPNVILFGEWAALFADLRNAKSSRRWLSILFGPPGSKTAHEEGVETTRRIPAEGRVQHANGRGSQRRLIGGSEPSALEKVCSPEPRIIGVKTMTSKLKHAALIATAAALSLAISTPAIADPQRAQAQANFKQADVNKDEQLDLAEFTTFINLNADHNLGRASMVRRLGMHSRAFGQADSNRDGVVSKQEIAAHAKQ